eukprot:3289773-Rhodomonas_salina.3
MQQSQARFNASDFPQDHLHAPCHECVWEANHQVQAGKRQMSYLPVGAMPVITDFHYLNQPELVHGVADEPFDTTTHWHHSPSLWVVSQRKGHWHWVLSRA